MASFPISPSSKFAVITPADDTALTWNGENMSTKGILVAVSGDLAVTDEADNTVIIPSVAAGVIHPIETSEIRNTATTATGICAFF